MKLRSLEDMIKAELGEDQALEVTKPKIEYNNVIKPFKPKCHNCEGIGHLSKDCRKPKKEYNADVFLKLRHFSR